MILKDLTNVIDYSKKTGIKNDKYLDILKTKKTLHVDLTKLKTLNERELGKEKKPAKLPAAAAKKSLEKGRTPNIYDIIQQNAYKRYGRAGVLNSFGTMYIDIAEKM
jgi:hypothetical protein